MATGFLQGVESLRPYVPLRVTRPTVTSYDVAVSNYKNIIQFSDIDPGSQAAYLAEAQGMNEFPFLNIQVLIAAQTYLAHYPPESISQSSGEIGRPYLQFTYENVKPIVEPLLRGVDEIDRPVVESRYIEEILRYILLIFKYRYPDNWAANRAAAIQGIFGIIA